MTRLNPRRPWYCHDGLVDDYRQVAASGGDFKMLRTLKILRSIIVNVGIIGVTLYALATTAADATLISALGLVTLGLYNGVEVADYAALAQAFAEAKASQSDDSESR
jgi:hypothetical protein